MLDTKKVADSNNVERIGKEQSNAEDYMLKAARSELESFGVRLNKLGVNFAVCNCECELLLLCDGNDSCTGGDDKSCKSRGNSSREQLIEYSRMALRQNNDRSCSDEAGMPVVRFGQANQILAAVLKLAPCGNNQGQTIGTALIDLGDRSPKPNVKYGGGGDHVAEKQQNGPRNHMSDAIFSEMLVLLAENFQARANTEKQIEMVSTELANVYEELVLLHKLSTNMKVTESDANFLQIACDSLTEIVSVEGIAVLLEKTVKDEKQLVLTAGAGLIDIDERKAGILYSRLTEEISSGKEALLDSEVDSPFKYDWPDSIRNIIAVPLYGKDKTEAAFGDNRKMVTPEGVQNTNRIIGLMIAINRIDKPDFDSTDVKLFNSVANGCAVFVENGRLFKDLEELFIGSLKALTSSIDAKDPYTRGHSERVAFISRWIAERLADQEPLERAQIQKIYLAGLLHDIGKMGIDEVVLRKKGKLTEQEFDRIKTHPSVGAAILAEIKQMRDIVPGVLCHHERMDGRGYPNGSLADRIPLMGKIIGLADSFDAMTSKRTYRDARTVEQSLVEIEKNLGTQFDEKVGRVFLSSDVYHLWDIMQDGFTEIYGAGNLAEYGAVAVGTLIR